MYCIENVPSGIIIHAALYIEYNYRFNVNLDLILSKLDTHSGDSVETC